MHAPGATHTGARGSPGVRQGGLLGAQGHAEPPPRTPTPELLPRTPPNQADPRQETRAPLNFSEKTPPGS